MKLVFSRLRDSLFAANQNFSFAYSLLTFIFNSATSVPEQKKFVSSANNTLFNIFDTLPISFEYNRNKVGPKIEPCGTP